MRYALICAAATALAIGAAAQDSRSMLAERVTALSRDSSWTLVATVPVSFRTWHAQGMVKIGDTFLVSSVEVRLPPPPPSFAPLSPAESAGVLIQWAIRPTERVPPKRRPQSADGYDRDAGEGVGHLFKISATGQLIADLKLGEGTIYHPGGIDYDGTSLWVPVAEYRPNGRPLVYRVDPETMTATQVLAFNDHIGAIVHDMATNTLHGVSWGSRRFYRWTLDGQGRVTNPDASPESLRRLNPSHYVDYQDCKSVAGERMLCTGVAEMRRTPDAPSFRLGGLDLVDLKEGRPVHQVPVLLWTAGGWPMTQNAVWLEPSAAGVRGYFMPEDDTSTIYIYDSQTR
jgi:hypothetical protein